jgi:hypothetical protein
MPQSTVGRSSGADLVELLEQSLVHKSSLIRVTGPSGLPFLLWLCRHGYEQVGYLRAGQGCPREQPDALIVAHPCDELALDQILSTGPHVREGGVLIFQSPLPAEAGEGADDPVHRRLAQSGYSLERCLHGARRELHVARRLPQTWCKAA